MGNEDEGLLGVVAVEDGGFCVSDLMECAAEMEGERGAALGRAPGNGFGQGVVNFEGTGAVAEALEFAGVLRGEAIARDLEELMRGEVAEGEGLGQFVEGVDAMAGVEGSVELVEAGDESVGNGLGSALRDGPADAVGCCGENETDGAAEGRVERHEGMGGETGKEGARSRVMEMEVGEGMGGEHGVESEAGHEGGLVGEAKDGTEGVFGKVPPLAGEGLHEALPGGSVRAEMGGGLGKIEEEAGGGAVVEGMGEGDFSVDPGESEALQVERAEKG